MGRSENPHLPASTSLFIRARSQIVCRSESPLLPASTPLFIRSRSQIAVPYVKPVGRIKRKCASRESAGILEDTVLTFSLSHFDWKYVDTVVHVIENYTCSCSHVCTCSRYVHAACVCKYMCVCDHLCVCDVWCIYIPYNPYITPHKYLFWPCGVTAGS